MRSEFLTSFAVTMVMLVPALVWTARMNKHLRRYVLAGFGLHVFAAIAQVAITKYYYGYGDMLAYFRTAREIAGYVQHGPEGAFADLVALIFQRPHGIVGVYGTANTGSMIGMASLVYLAVGDSLWASAILFGLNAYLGKLALFVAVERALGAMVPVRWTAMAILFLPSFTFWSSGILKEAVAVAGLGWLCWGFMTLLHRGVGHGAALTACAIGATLAGLVKFYLVFGFVAAASIAYYVRWTLDRGRPVRILTSPLQLIGAAGAMVLAMAVLGWLFPEYAVDHVAEEVVSQRESAMGNQGASSLAPAEGGVATGFIGNLVYAPIGLISVLFRPFLFEARNPFMLVSALEMTFVLVLVYRLWRRAGFMKTWRIISGHPVLMFCAVFTLLVGVGVGLATLNMGSMSRYRAPLLPFYAIVLVGATGIARFGPDQRRAAAFGLTAHSARTGQRRPRSGKRFA